MRSFVASTSHKKFQAIMMTLNEVLFPEMLVTEQFRALPYAI
jgi:hypothetical protein